VVCHARRKPSKTVPRQKELVDSQLPTLPSLLTQPLGPEGWAFPEAALLAVLASEDALLLIGNHGSIKSFHLARLAQALGLEYQFSYASIINYDNLDGIPVQAEDRKTLKYISRPSAFWDTEAAFFDEINRTQSELQNKLFPIIHERRVKHIKLEKLR